MRLAVICPTSYQDYVIDMLLSHPEVGGKVVFFLAWSDILTSSYRGIPKIFISDLKEREEEYDAVLIIMPDSTRAFKILSRIVLLAEGGTLEKDIFLVYPSRVSKQDLIVGNTFDPVRVQRFPFSVEALERFENLFYKKIAPSEIAKKKHVTFDGIEAYDIEDMFVKIGEPLGKSEGPLGCVYTRDQLVITSCLNGRPNPLEAGVAEHLALYKDVPFFGYAMEKSLDLRFEPDMVYDDPVCVLTRPFSSWNYGHLFLEVFDKVLIAEELGFEGRYMLFHSADMEQLLALRGIDIDRIIWIEQEDVGKVYLVKNAFEMQGFNVDPGPGYGLTRLRAFARKVTAGLANDEDRANYPRRLYVKRIGRRGLLGVEDIVRKYNFFTMIPEEHTLEEEIKFFYYADVVLLPHGGALPNILFMRDNSAVVETYSCDYNHVIANTMTILSSTNLIYRPIVEPYRSEILAEARLTGKSGNSRDYKVNNQLLDYTLKELLSRS